MPRRCRICGKPIPPGAQAKSVFCSERCRLIDLAKWMGEEYRVPVKAEETEDAPAAIPGDRDDETDA